MCRFFLCLCMDNEDVLKFTKWVNDSFAKINDLKPNELIDSEDVKELALLNGMDIPTHEINKILTNEGYISLNIPGAIAKIWLIEENIETQ